MILMLDNYDSFTYNLVQYLRELDAQVKVVRNDQISIAEIKAFNPEKIIISPGPGRPIQAGISLQLIQQFAGHIPILGVCLGHQAIAEAYGARIKNAREIMHGKTSLIYHENQGIFADIINPLQATRYHSLVIDQDTLPTELIITAHTRQSNGEMDEIMGIRHRQFLLEGIQFHPESILTEQGHRLLQNFLQQSMPLTITY